MTELSGYVFSPLREGDFTLYRGTGNGLAPVLLVTAEDASLGCLKRLEHEYALRAELDATWAARPVALSRYNDRVTLVLEDPGGEPLDRLLDGPLEMTEFLRIALPLAGALRQVHARGLIHKDIKPGNILLDKASGGAWFTGFGIASRLPRERQNPEAPEVIAGTLAYMAPEQTGRMNRSIDARSDLYSLGITFYEMLTGTLPFPAADPMEWVHCHIARQPTPPVERATVPGPISAVVMKLLAKTAEERYQTAAGVEADLRRCLADWESYGRIDPFPLGAHDVSDRLLIPEKLYGREREIDALLASFDRVVAKGTPELVLVSGYAGIGKSSVVSELHKVLVPPRGLFASGKFDQYKRDIPYATLAQAFQSLVRPLLSRSERELGRWRDTLNEALGPNGQLIVNLVPELELVIGRQPPVADLPSQDAKHRFQMVFRRFLGVFARNEHPLVLFLDDVQWLDAATLDLLEHLITHSEVRHLLLVGAYRDNEVSSSHPLMRTLEAIRKADATVHEIVLAPLGLDDVGRLVADALQCAPDRAQPLAQLVHERTGGNPFFAIQFFIALADEGLLAFDTVAPAWQWDMDRIRAKSYTDNVVDLMAGKLRRLSTPAQEALKQLACLGNVAEIATLTLVHGQTEEALHAALWEAVHAGLVLHQGSAYKFLHDRIQQAAYLLIPEAHRADVHLRIARMLLASMTTDELAEHLFEVANQFNRGAALRIDRDEKAQVATIDLRAGRKAKASAAYASACGYFAAGMALLDERDWGSQYELTFSLWLERAECEFLSGNFDTAELLIGELLRRAASKVDQAAVYHLKVRLHVLKAENPQAVDSVLTCLRLFGIDFPAHPSWEQAQAEYEMVWQTLNERPIEHLIDLPLMTDPEMLAAMHVLSVVTASAFNTDINLYYLLLCRMVNVSLQHGTSGASAHGCSNFGVFLGPVFHRYSEGYRFAKLACDLVEKHGFIAYRAKVYLAMGIVAVWTQPIATAIDFNRAAFRTATETGDLTTACYSMFQPVTDLLLRGDPLDAVWRESERGLDFARRARFRSVTNVIVSQQRFIATMQGRTATVSTFSDTQFDEAAFEAQVTGDRMTGVVCWYWILKLKARFLSGDYAEALAAADKAKVLLWVAVGLIPSLDYFYYTALTVAALYENASADEQTGWRDLLTAHREQLREWAENYPPTFADKHVLVAAEIARLEGRESDAMRLYEQAIQAARAHGFVQNEGTAHEMAARFYAARGFETIAHAYLRNARNCYDRWGALGKLKQLDARYPHLHEARTPTSLTATIGMPVGQLDVETVVKASQALSSEIVLPTLIEKLMRIAVEHAGAERGLLILLRGDEPQIEAEATTGHGRAEVTVRRTAVTPSDLPQSALHYVIRTRERVILDDASVSSLYSEDEYVRRQRPRSVLCLPIVKQTKLVGALYLENSLTPSAFTSARVAVLELLASQAAISLENANLYADLQRSEAAIRASEKSLRLIIDTIPGFVCTLSTAGEVELLNRQVLEYFGKAAEELKNWATSDAVHPDDLPRVIDAWRRSVETGQPYEHEYRQRRADGAHRWFQSRALPARDTEGRITGWYMLLTDIDDRKRAEEKLQRSEAFLTEAQSMSHTGSFGWRVSTGEILWSEETFRIFQYEGTTKPTGELILQRVHPDDAALVQQTIERASQDGKDFDFEHRLLMPDGSVKHVHIVAHAEREQSGELEFVGAVMDVTAAKEAEERIRQDERELRITIETIPTIISSTLPDGSVDFVSQRWLDYVGRSREEILGGAWKSTIHPEDLDRVLNNWQAAVAAGEPLERETRYRRADGKYRWFLVRSLPLRDDKGNIVKWYATAFDIEDRKRADARLEQSEAYLAEAQRLAHTGSWALNVATGEPTHSSEEHLRLFGFDPERGLPSREAFHQRIHPEDQDSVVEATERAIGERTDFEVDFRTVLPDGTIKYLHALGHPVFNAAGDLVELIGTSMEVTERKRAEEALRQGEKELREVQRVAQLGSWQWDPEVDVVTWSEEVYRVFGRAPNLPAPSSQEHAQLFTAESWERLQRAVNEALRAGTPYAIVDLEMVRPDGTTGWLTARGEAQHDDAGRMVRLRGTVMDITERKHAEEALRQAQAELAHVTRVATLGELTASIAHEINQPLGAVVNNASACVRWLAAQNLEEARRSAALVIADGHRAADIIGRIRNLAKKAPLQKDWLDINDTIRDVLTLARSEAQAHLVSLQTQLADDVPLILGDRIQVQQVLLNLMMNAIEAMRGAGEGPRELWVSSKRTESRDVLIAVRDSGPGLDPKSLDRLFDAFYTTKPHGLGMGLAISRSIVEAHGGRLWATANAPHGAIFQFTLPVGDTRVP